MEQKRKIVIGSSSRAQYEIDKEIGRGGQGRVFSIKGGKYAFKLLGKKSSIKSQTLKNKISYIKTRPIGNLPISKPLEQVEGEALGYIMEMATGMMPLSNLLQMDNDFIKWWRNTGGLKKRFQILNKLAKILTSLHNNGLVYGDLSPSNIFISEDPNYSEVFLIDADNITHNSKVGTAVYTPGYGAPEIITALNHKPSSGYDTYTDYYSFAIIAYQLLTLNHPFIGDYVNDGEPELEELAYLGQIPWINHSFDNKNNTEKGIPHELGVSETVLKNFQNIFENGVKNKFDRTSTSKWSELISSDGNLLIKCTNGDCNMHFIKNEELICPFCNKRSDNIGLITFSPFILSQKKEIEKEHAIKLKNVSNIGKPLVSIILQKNNYLIITEHLLKNNNSSKKLFKVKLQKNSFLIKGMDQKTVSLISKDNKYKPKIAIDNEIKVPLNTFIITDEIKNYQRIINIKKL